MPAGKGPPGDGTAMQIKDITSHPDTRGAQLIYVLSTIRLFTTILYLNGLHPHILQT